MLPVFCTFVPKLKETMIATTDYDDKHVLFKKEFELKKGVPVRCNHLAFIYNTEGDAKFEINYSVYHARQNSMVLFFPLDIVTMKDCSHNYNPTIFFIPMPLISDHSAFMNTDFNFIEKLKQNQVMPLYGKESDIASKVYNMLDAAHEAFEYEQFEQAALSMVHFLSQLYIDHFKKYDNRSTGGCGYESRKKTLFRKFVKEIVASRSKSREVLYYANELGVSSGYLNEVCNEVSNYSAKDIIDSAVSSRLKYELSYTDKSVQELADEYNFPSQSYFSRYYKRMTGLSPSEFRKQRRKG